jgi:peptidyl-prolyl cis-trans isomerase C
MSKITALFTVALAAATAVAAPTPTLPANAPLVTNGALVVDASDFEGALLRIPENRRDEVRINPKHVSEVIDQVFVSRSFAERARQLGLDKDAAVQKRIQQVQDQVLAELYVQKMEKEVAVGNLEQRARELYRVEQSKYMTKEEVYIQHILVNLEGRTRETAMERARQALADAKSGQDFLAVATRWSDDPDKTRNGGDLGYSSPTAFVEPVRKAIDGLRTKGEIAGPVESRFGFHIIKFVDRKPAEPIKFEAIGKKLIESEQEKLKKRRLEQLIAEVRDAPTVVIHKANVEKLVLPVDPKALRAAREAPAAAPK